ncbi:MAG: class I SAM-dependent methyltransferase [Leptolyngbya sp. SIOISBB]|nr:class I SAM-dependent methyltransferase [Leptolyngbya sp. SIOISBB]
MPDTLTKMAYQAFQDGKNYFGLGHKAIATQLREWLRPQIKLELKSISADFLEALTRRRQALLETDWQDAEAGIYPKSLLFDNPWMDFFQYYPAIWLDLPLIWDRVETDDVYAFDKDIDTAIYPSYYRRNFHNQTNGYLSDLSANLYDTQVELLFGGTADPMRRRILAPLKQALQNQATATEVLQDTPPSAKTPLKVLDIACGTARTLKMVRDVFPDVSLFGIDLSPAYLRKANQLLSETPGTLPQLMQGQAEDMPYREGFFDALICIFLFHELPGPVRQQIIDEAYRVAKPGSTFIICDSIQMIDTPELEPMMINFPALFHEPFYRDYTYDNLSDRLASAGFVDIETAIHFVSKYWIARKPAS